MKHQPAATPAAEELLAGLEALSSLTGRVLDAHTDAAGLCVVCGASWPCELILLADHNYNLAAL
jgi:hypothetical protein